MERHLDGTSHGRPLGLCLGVFLVGLSSLCFAAILSLFLWFSVFVFLILSLLFSVLPSFSSSFPLTCYTKSLFLPGIGQGSSEHYIYSLIFFFVKEKAAFPGSQWLILPGICGANVFVFCCFLKLPPQPNNKGHFSLLKQKQKPTKAPAVRKEKTKKRREPPSSRTLNRPSFPWDSFPLKCESSAEGKRVWSR